MNKELLYLIFQSWYKKKGNVNSLEAILEWIDNKNRCTHVSIQKKAFDSDDSWTYQPYKKGIVHKTNGFFSIKGLIKKENGQKVMEQPIIIQDEIGYLGMICKEMDGVLNFLIQAKIEPGNINKVQISPTLQATKSNFMQVHGGRKPLYLDYFVNKSKYEVLVDQIQSEHASYFLGKRNRNIIILVDEEIEVSPNHMWATLGQIKELMKINNLVNMDTRTVISCIPIKLDLLNAMEKKEIRSLCTNTSIFNSMLYEDNNVVMNSILQYINDYKMIDSSVREIVDLNELDTWRFKKEKMEFVRLPRGPFKVIYCNIEIEGREVLTWTQPLIETSDINILGLIRCDDNGVMKFLVRAVAEIGCFDKMEIGPSVNINLLEKNVDDVEWLFLRKYNNKDNIVFDSLFSEEGGRFLNGQNHNVIIEIKKDELKPPITEGYFWIDFHGLNKLVQINHCLNIQLRNLMSLIEL